MHGWERDAWELMAVCLSPLTPVAACAVRDILYDISGFGLAPVPLLDGIVECAPDSEQTKFPAQGDKSGTVVRNGSEEVKKEGMPNSSPQVLTAVNAHACKFGKPGTALHVHLVLTAWRGSLKKSAPFSQVPFPTVPSDDDDDDNIDPEDLAFVEEYSGRLGFLQQLRGKELDKAIQEHQQKEAIQAHKKPKGGKNAEEGLASKSKDAISHDSEEDSDTLEEMPEYERIPRQEWMPVGEKLKPQLPIKTMDGKVIFEDDEKQKQMNAAYLTQRVEGVTVEEIAQHDQIATRKEEENDGHNSREESGTSSEQNDTTVELLNSGESTRGAVYDWNRELEEAQAFQDRAQHMEDLKEQMAMCANRLLENPEDHAKDFKRLLDMVDHPLKQISKLAMMTLMAVFKDVVPAYRIRLPTETELKMRVSKEIANLRAYESFLLHSYQAYLKKLLAVTKTSKGTVNGEFQHRRVAMTCLCGLLSSLHHFNYTSDLLQAVIPSMADSEPTVRNLCCSAIREVLQGDVAGDVTLEAVQLVSDLVRRKHCKCSPEIVAALMELKFPDVKHCDSDEMEGTGANTRKIKRKRRKCRKHGGDDVDKSFEVAEAGPSVEEKAAAQSRTVEALYEIFFRVVKHCTRIADSESQQEKGTLHSIDLQRKCPLLYISLQGLSKYSHLLSVEYFADLLQVLQQLLNSASLPLLERLRCLLTASDILRGEGSALNVDRQHYYQQLYLTLKEAGPDEQLRDVALPEMQDASSLDAVQQVSANGNLGVLMVQVVNQMLCETKSFDHSRLAAFAKILMYTGMHQETGCLMGIVAVVNRLLLRNYRVRGMLDGDGSAPAAGRGYDPAADDPSEAGGLSATLWDLCVLSRHYHPHVAQAARQVMSIPLEPGTSASVTGVLSSVGGPVALAAEYNTSAGVFCPAPRPPHKASQKMGCRVQDLQTAEAFAAAAVTGTSVGGQGDESLQGLDGEDSDLLPAFRKLYSQSKAYCENRALRRKQALLSRQLQEYRRHLAERGSRVKQKQSDRAGG
eukprot:evm.model.scf_1207.4 EVM.evm.TU.scf_1207.4   scf_1207:16888-32564(-)